VAYNERDLLGYGQLTVWPRNKALEKCFTSLVNIKQEKCTFITNKDIIKIAIPYKIGCCRGGEDWNKVYSIIENLFKNSNDIELQIWKYDKEKRR
jgi:hypothetical protein